MNEYSCTSIARLNKNKVTLIMKGKQYYEPFKLKQSDRHWSMYHEPQMDKRSIIHK